MNNSFPRILTALRKEQKLSQKQAAKDLGISQALLSHYEKGIRECGLEFLVRCADYYNVSCDYLLGKTSAKNKSVQISDKAKKASKDDPGETAVISALRAVFKLCDGFSRTDLKNELIKYFKLSLYKTFRILYCANGKNSGDIFSLDEKSYLAQITAKTVLCENRIVRLSNGESIDSGRSAPKYTLPAFSADKITGENEKYAKAIIGVIEEAETL